MQNMYNVHVHVHVLWRLLIILYALCSSMRAIFHVHSTCTCTCVLQAFSPLFSVCYWASRCVPTMIIVFERHVP